MEEKEIMGVLTVKKEKKDYSLLSVVVEAHRRS